MNRANKKQAVELVRRAVKAGFKRSVDSVRFGPGAPAWTQVNLFDLGEGRISARQIIVTFRRNGKRITPAIVSGRIFSYGNTPPKRSGLWNANYLLSNP